MIGSARKWMTKPSTYSLLVACKAKVSHTFWAFGLAHTTCKGVETFLALGVPHEAPFLTAITLLERTCSTTVALWFIAEGKEIGVALWAVLIAHWSNTCVPTWAFGITECKNFFFVLVTLIESVSHTTTVCFFPTRSTTTSCGWSLWTLWR